MPACNSFAELLRSHSALIARWNSFIFM